jgi:hypothetical protein
VRLESARGSVVIGTRTALSSFLDDVPVAPAIAGYRLGCRSPGGLAERCARTGAKVKRRGKRYSVALAAALGGNWILTSS